MKKTRQQIVDECREAIRHFDSIENTVSFANDMTIRVGRQFYQDVIDAYEEEQVKKPLTLIYLKQVMKQSDIDFLTEYYEQMFGTKVIVLANNVDKVVQIDPESHIGTIFMNANEKYEK